MSRTANAIEVRARVVAKIVQIRRLPNNKWDAFECLLKKYGVSVSTAPGYNHRQFNTDEANSNVFVIVPDRSDWPKFLAEVAEL